MSQEELDLFDFAARGMAQAGASAPPMPRSA